METIEELIAHEICNGKEQLRAKYEELERENQQLKDKIDFYEGELHRRGYVIAPKE